MPLAEAIPTDLGPPAPAAPHAPPALEQGELVFAAAPARARLRQAWEAAGALTVVLAIDARGRGRLGEVVDEAIERALGAGAAGGPGVFGDAARDRDAVLSDQLFRARRMGKRAIGLVVGPLDSARGEGAALGPEDTATLRFLASATRDRPLFVALDPGARTLHAHAVPVLLGALLDPAPSAPRPAPAPPAVAQPEALAPARAPRRLPAEATPAHDVEPEAWRHWMLALTAARGPQPLSAFERLFQESYLPLLDAVATGHGDARARQAVEEFRRTFARAYADAHPTFAVTGKRPKMVLDAPEIAARLGRLHGARSAHLVIVSSLGADAGAIVKDSLTRALEGRASLAAELLLFAALPTTHARQVDALARGVDALRGAPGGDASDEPTPRGRAAEIVRRARVGLREMHSLDLVDARLRDAGDGARAALPAVALAAADALVRHAASLAPRTLLFVFGDHGVTFDARGAARSGGPSPEEVLVPAYAFLIGDVH